MPRIDKITKSFLDNTPLPESGQVAYWEKSMPGFAAVFGKTVISFIAQKDINARPVRCTIGRYGHFTVDEARRLAKDKLYLMAQGINPNKLAEEEKKTAITLRDTLKSYEETRKNIKQSTKDSYAYHVQKYAPDWLDKLMTDIDRNMIVARHTLIGETSGPQTANGTMRVVRALFNHANATFDICENNPVSYLSRIRAWYPEKRRRTYIKPHQLKAWWEAVHALENDTQRDFLLLLLFTGLRRNEAASLKWECIDFKDRTFRIQKTKNGDPLALPMSDFLFEIFEARRLRHGNSEFVFPGPGKYGFLAEPKKAVYKVTAETSIQFTCHDLRRTFITIAESLDLPYYALKELMNHRSGDVTSGYIVIDVERLRNPVQKIADYILEQVK